MDSYRAYFSSPQSFHTYYEAWLREQQMLVDELESAINSESERNEVNLPSLIDRTMEHYRQYYIVKRNCCEEDVLSLLSPSWTSSTEDYLLWIGGWRPTTAFNLLYSMAGMHIDARDAAILQGIPRRVDLNDLTRTQVDRVQRALDRAYREEEELTEEMAGRQAGVADEDAVKEAQSIRESREGGEAGFNSVMLAKEEGVKKVVERADDLRLGTLNLVVSILEPIQAVQYLIAAAILHRQIHEYGKKRDDPDNALGQLPRP